MSSSTRVEPSPTARTEYEEHGFVVFREVIDAGLVAEAGAHVEWLSARHPELRPEKLGTALVADDPFWLRLVSDERLLDVAEQFIGPDIVLFASHYISKPAYSGLPVLWHQDAAFWPLEPMEVVSLWLAIDQSLPENGCLRVIPGSHRLPVHALRKRTDVESVLGSEMAVDNVDEKQAVDLVLAPGDLSVHNPNIVHGSLANTSALRRCGLTIRYIPATTRIVTEGPWPSAFLLRGEAVPGANQYNQRPRYVAGRHLAFKGCEAWT